MLRQDQEDQSAMSQAWKHGIPRPQGVVAMTCNQEWHGAPHLELVSKLPAPRQHVEISQILEIVGKSQQQW